MYAKDDGYIYFDSIEEAKKQYALDSESVWEVFWYIDNWYQASRLNFNLDISKYRRLLTPDFRVRKEFREGDPVCHAGVNDFAIVKPYNEYQIKACGWYFYENGILGGSQHGALQSLFHGHDIHRIEDSKYPVERIEVKEETKEQKTMSWADEVAECVPHWVENVKRACEKRPLLLGWRYCPLCIKYYSNACKGCPIYKKTRSPSCHATPYDEVVKNRDVKSCIAMTQWLIDFEQQLREEGK
jgi:hypothetical protein